MNYLIPTGDTSQIMVKFYLADQYIPTSLSVGIVTSYITHAGAPRIITTNVSQIISLRRFCT